MGYTFTIGNAVPEFSKDDGYLRAEWVVQPASSDAAPTFPHDDLTGNSNSRSPSYIVWLEFCNEAGIHDVFYDDRNNLHAGHPGCIMITPEDLANVRLARTARQVASTKPPGFDGWEQFDPETQQWSAPDEGKYDPILARLIWLEWWMDWALANCETPAIQNT